MYGGFIGALLASIVYFKIKKLPFCPTPTPLPEHRVRHFLRASAAFSTVLFRRAHAFVMGITFPAGARRLLSARMSRGRALSVAAH